MIVATKQQLIWIDVTFKKVTKKSISLTREFYRWILDENLLPDAKGFSGPLGFSGGWYKIKAKKILIWLKDHKINVTNLQEGK